MNEDQRRAFVELFVGVLATAVPILYEAAKAAIPAPIRLALAPFSGAIRSALGSAWEKRFLPSIRVWLERAFQTTVPELNANAVQFLSPDTGKQEPLFFKPADIDRKDWFAALDHFNEVSIKR